MKSMTAYYKSLHWKRLSSRILSDINVRCQICDRPRWGVYKRATDKHIKDDKKRLLTFHCHHKHYRSLKNESRDDLLVLCANCHDLSHQLHKSSGTGSIWQSIYIKLSNETDWEYEK